jgi:hypothetical protein
VRDDLHLEFPNEGHPLIAKFIALRSKEPEPAGDHISQTRPRTLFKVDASEHGRVWRGATWFDRTNDVVFLVAAGLHRSGARDDFYARLVRRLAGVYPQKLELAQVRLASAERATRALRELIPTLLESVRRDGVVVRWLPHCRVRIEASPSLELVATKGSADLIERAYDAFKETMRARQRRDPSRETLPAERVSKEHPAPR